MRELPAANGGVKCNLILPIHSSTQTLVRGGTQCYTFFCPALTEVNFD